uniref:Uncharacterized protein n=1 Tax=Arundo donax TaxID=35708 RepID=A0A0A9AZI2_ARUDO
MVVEDVHLSATGVGERRIRRLEEMARRCGSKAATSSVTCGSTPLARVSGSDPVGTARQAARRLLHQRLGRGGMDLCQRDRGGADPAASVGREEAVCFASEMLGGGQRDPSPAALLAKGGWRRGEAGGVDPACYVPLLDGGEVLHTGFLDPRSQLKGVRASWIRLGLPAPSPL